MATVLLPCPAGITWSTKAKVCVNPSRQGGTGGKHDLHLWEFLLRNLFTVLICQALLIETVVRKCLSHSAF